MSSGKEIQAIADALDPIQPTGLGPAALVISILFAIISFIIVSLRIYVRAGFSKVSGKWLGMDDYLTIAGTLPFIVSAAFAVLAVRYGVGSHDASIPSQLYLIRAVEYQTIWELLYFVSSTIIKCAIGFTCTRLDSRKSVVIVVYLNMIVMVIVALLAIIFVFANCKPFAATWNPALGTCQKTISLQTVSYIVSAIQMVTDWVCATAPFYIVLGLHMSRRRKISVLAILGLGVLASIATCVRMPFLKYYDTTKYPNEIAYHLGVITITSNIECSLGIIASSLAPLRKLFKFYYGSSNDSGKYTSQDHPTVGSCGVKLKDLEGRHAAYNTTVDIHHDSRERETDDDDSSRKGIVRKTEVLID